MSQVLPLRTDHDAPPEATAVAEPIGVVPPARRRTAAEEARTLVAQCTTGTLSTISADGGPWASFVAYGQLPDGSPVLLVSTLAEHGRNLPRDGRASLCVVEPSGGEDPLDSGRVTLAGVARRPEREEAAEAALSAFQMAVPMSRHYASFGDFSLWVLEVERVRWVGGYGRMDSATAAGYAAAEPDPVAGAAAHAVRHLNEDHADALLSMARALAGFPDAEQAVCKRADRYGLDLWVSTPRGKGPARVPFREPCSEPGGLRAATVELARRSRGEAT